MNEDSEKFYKYLTRLRDIYLGAINAFYLFEGIEELRSPTIVGKDVAEKNAQTMSDYGSFFMMTRHALNTFFLIELARMLDYSDSLRVNKLISCAHSNRGKIDRTSFLEKNRYRPFVNDLAKIHKGIENEDIRNVKRRLEEIEPIRKKVKDHRDKSLAHEDLKKSEVFISREEIKEAFDAIADILDIFSNKTLFSSYDYSCVEESCKSNLKEIIERLK